MIRALLCLSLFFSLVTPPIHLLISLTYPDSVPSIPVPNTTLPTWFFQTKYKKSKRLGDIKLNCSHAVWGTRKVRHKLTKGGNFDEDSMEVRWYHLGEQGSLVSVPQVGQGLQTQSQTSAQQHVVDMEREAKSWNWIFASSRTTSKQTCSDTFSVCSNTCSHPSRRLQASQTQNTSILSFGSHETLVR